MKRKTLLCKQMQKYSIEQLVILKLYTFAKKILQ